LAARECISYTSEYQQCRAASVHKYLLHRGVSATPVLASNEEYDRTKWSLVSYTCVITKYKYIKVKIEHEIQQPLTILTQCNVGSRHL